MLSAHHGEDDALTRFFAGPGLTMFHSIWRYKKVSISGVLYSCALVISG